jgi:hypothetical protein
MAAAAGKADDRKPFYASMSTIVSINIAGDPKSAYLHLYSSNQGFQQFLHSQVKT